MKQVLYFSAGWCSACQTTTPAVDQLKKAGKTQVAKFDTDYDVSYVDEYKIKSVPTIIVLENGNEIKRHSGALNYEQLNRLVNG